jgi:hypothetical protein
MPERTENSNHLRFLNDVIFAVYLCLLVIMANSVRSVLHSDGHSWVYRFSVTLGFGRPLSYGDPGLRFVFLLLWLGSATLVFLSVRLLSRLSSVRSFFRVVSGIVAVAGFPMAGAYASFRGYLNMLGSIPQALLNTYDPRRWLGLEVLASLVGVFLYAFSKRLQKPTLALPMLFLHFAVWSWLVILGAGSGNILLWPGYNWVLLTRERPSLIYPLLGLLASVVWGLYVRRPNQSH